MPNQASVLNVAFVLTAAMAAVADLPTFEVDPSCRRFRPNGSWGMPRVLRSMLRTTSGFCTGRAHLNWRKHQWRLRR
jgi:hypothetical protein